MPYPLPLTRTEAYLAYKAGVIQQSDLKPSLAVPRNGIDAWLAYWTGLAEDYPKREDGTPHILQEEEAYIAYLCGVLDEYPEKCLRRVGAYLRYIISARWGRPDHPLNREELYLSLIKTQFIPSGDPSSDIVIDGTAKAEFVDVKMYGDTYQQSYTGKNLFEYIPADNKAQGLISTIDSNGVVTVTGTGTARWSDISQLSNNASPSGTYTITISTTGTGTLPRNINLRLADGNNSNLQTVTVGINESVTETLVAHTKWRVFLATDADVVYNCKIKIQVEAGSDSTSFEPYVGGTPSPNPDYPQPIQTVTGTQTVSVNGTDYPISLGSIELCKLGEYQDYIWKDGEDWKIHKATDRFIFTKAITYGLSNQSLGFVYNTSGNPLVGKHIPLVGKCSHFDVEPTTTTWTALNKTGMNSGGALWFRTTDTNFGDTRTTTEFAQWLVDAGVSFVYAIETPTDTVITDSTLIAQLEALVKGGSEEGTTYIKVSATDPNLPGLLYVEAAEYIA